MKKTYDEIENKKKLDKIRNSIKDYNDDIKAVKNREHEYRNEINRNLDNEIACSKELGEEIIKNQSDIFLKKIERIHLLKEKINEATKDGDIDTVRKVLLELKTLEV